MSVPQDFGDGTIAFELDGGVATATLNRPQRLNAIDRDMWAGLIELGRWVSESSEVRCLVLTGAGRAFCSGADLAAAAAGEGAAGEERHLVDQMRRTAEAALAVHGIPQPVVAKLNGVAAGAGANLALAADLVVASEEASFIQVFARRGLSVDFGGSWVLPRLVGLHRAKQMALLADVVDAAEAERIGLVNRVVPHELLDEAVAEWAGRLAAGPPIALAATKRLLNAGISSSLDQALEAETMVQAVNFGTEDVAEAVAAFLDKREPEFRGR
jgi:2-(1,2-epoxy-1,2-dihydrophenyl)acetyl-CoA isomerase